MANEPFTFEQKTQQYRTKIEELQEKQVALKKQRRYVEEQQEAYFELQQREQSVYGFVLTNCEPEERTYIEDRGSDSLFLAKKAQREFDEERLQLEKEERFLFEQKEYQHQVYRSFMRESKESDHGA
ncbi:hypothetical protein [Enterococcus sp. UD-01]|jgi:hypothetical protein|uniref:hypothetical protein n=1 Tax=Enterococcus sp. UD-01 TaxID=3373911 RepID=UPI003839510F